MKRILAGFLAIMAIVGCNGKNEKNVELNFHFATEEEGRRIISTSDDFTKSLNNFDLVSRLQEAGLEPTEENYLKLCESSVLPWTENEIIYLEKAAERIGNIIDSCGYNLPLPDDITLIKTSMVEEGGAGGYTRGTCIFLESLESVTSENTIFVDYLLAHELFHVLTRNSPEFRESMYSQIDFHILDKEIEFNDALLEMRITNPDVNHYDNYSVFTINGEKMPCTMWLYNDREYNGGPFFTYGKPGLVPLDEDFQPVQNKEDGSPIIYNIEDAVDFYQFIGKNTDYIINPEEALADNFAFALLDYFPDGKVSPEVIDKLRTVMKGTLL